VTNLARCPQCNAALPHGAPWCSLCHADLRPPPPEPEVAAAEVDADVLDPEAALPVPAPVRGGRHRRGAPVPAPSAGTSRLAVPDSVTPDPAALVERSALLVAETPKGEDGNPDIELLASALLAELEASEAKRTGLPAWDRVPGGKWTVLAGGMVALTLVLVGLSAVLGAIFVR
jgi:ribosomal protein L40E